MATLQRFLEKFRPVSIRHRLLLAFLMMVLIPAIAFGAISGIVVLKRGREQVLDKLTSVAVLKEDELNIWAENAKIDLASVMIGDEVLQWINTLLSNSASQAEVEEAYANLHTRFGVLLEETKRFEELNILNKRGVILLSTDIEREGWIGARAVQAYMTSGGEGEYLNPPSYSLASLTEKGVGIVVVRPVYDTQGNLLGILAGRASSARLGEIMLERTGLGKTGETYLVASNQVMLTEARPLENPNAAANYVFSDGATEAVRYHNNGSGIYLNHRGERVVGVYRWLPGLQVALLAEQAEYEAMAIVRQTLAINVGVAVAAALLAVGVSVVLAQSIAAPLTNLAQMAGRVSEGDLKLVVPVESEDEIGSLARAFNNMTGRLRELIDNLDLQVKERTRMLRRRAVQLETSAQVGREIISILDMEELLGRIVSLIAEAFGYYNVGIYLVGADSGKLVFRAGAGEVKELARGIPLEIGTGSLNGEAASKNTIIIVNDVAQDPRFFVDERYPDTQSELVVPLRIGERVIGTLDVQSTEIGAFSEEDARIIQGLGDQVAVAIENARLYAHSRALAVVEERNRLARDLHDSVTQSLYSLHLVAGTGLEVLSRGENQSVKGQLERIAETAQQALKEMRLLVYELRPSALEQEGLEGALQHRLDAVERRTGMRAAFQLGGELNISESMQVVLYRIAQEALNNILKHAAATSVSIKIESNGRQVVLEVVDDGIGFDPGKVSGLGLTGMKERAEHLGGSLEVFALPEKGTTVRVRIPCNGSDSGGG